jgi:hypothetical protein
MENFFLKKKGRKGISMLMIKQNPKHTLNLSTPWITNPILLTWIYMVHIYIYIYTHTHKRVSRWSQIYNYTGKIIHIHKIKLVNKCTIRYSYWEMHSGHTLAVFQNVLLAILLFLW